MPSWSGWTVTKDRRLQVARQGRGGGPRGGHKMMRLVEDDPMRPAGLGAQFEDSGQQPVEKGRPVGQVDALLPSVAENDRAPRSA
jgi:hypothetical protein